jgi:hypothetical protein
MLPSTPTQPNQQASDGPEASSRLAVSLDYPHITTNRPTLHVQPKVGPVEIGDPVVEPDERTEARTRDCFKKDL